MKKLSLFILLTVCSQSQAMLQTAVCKLKPITNGVLGGSAARRVGVTRKIKPANLQRFTKKANAMQHQLQKTPIDILGAAETKLEFVKKADYDFLKKLVEKYQNLLSGILKDK